MLVTKIAYGRSFGDVYGMDDDDDDDDDDIVQRGGSYVTAVTARVSRLQAAGSRGV